MKYARSQYNAVKISKPLILDADWFKADWERSPSLILEHHMGDKPDHRPTVACKITWDDQALYLIFKVEDQYIRAVAKEHQDAVCKDSCVEFFFTPDSQLSRSYFNLELNCGGTMLFWWHPENGKALPVASEDCQLIEVAHSMPKRVYPEITERSTWTIEYRLPLSIITKYYPEASKPSEGTSWKANLYKCADDCSHPHWLTWSYVDHPTPKFHLPQNFGRLNFV